MEDLYQRAEDASHIFEKLMSKFGLNLSTALKASTEELGEAELRARACAEVGKILSQTPGLTETQRQITCLFSEIFGDLISSLYLGACALDRPAQMVLRRVLELGVATVYLWDLPHVFWGWKHHDMDLNFKEMMEHLSSPGYKSFVFVANGCPMSQDVLDGPEARALYRDLSNAIHGKLSTFETLIADRFTHTPCDWEHHLGLVRRVEKVLLAMWKIRFRAIESGLELNIPQLQRISETGNHA